MNRTKVVKIAAFTKDAQGGNSAGLVWPAAQFNASQRQAIATEVGYSETAFVERNPKGELRIEYFTPNRQIDICGHATVAAFSYLRDLGEVISGLHEFESVIGKHQVEVKPKTVGLWQEQLLHLEVSNQRVLTEIQSSLGIKPSDIIGPLKIASNGSPFLLVELSSLSSLKGIVPNQDQIFRLSEELRLVGYYLYVKASETEIDARMFAPLYGIEEESATGMAAGALALSLSRESDQKALLIRQGHLMPNPSVALLYTEVFDDKRVLVSGEARTVFS